MTGARLVAMPVLIHTNEEARGPFRAELVHNGRRRDRIGRRHVTPEAAAQFLERRELTPSSSRRRLAREPRDSSAR